MNSEETCPSEVLESFVTIVSHIYLFVDSTETQAVGNNKRVHIIILWTVSYTHLTTITTSKTEIDLGSGDVTLTMAGTEKDYNYNIDCGSGDVKIGDILFEDDLKKRNILSLIHI